MTVSKNYTLPSLPDSGQPAQWTNLPGASVSWVLSSVLDAADAPVLIITPDNFLALKLQEELSFFDTHSNPILYFPDRETLPYDRFSPHHDIISDRISTLYQLQHLKKGALITPISTLMHRIPPLSFLNAHTFLLSRGDKLDLEATRTRLIKAGYYYVTQVREHGEFSIRGSIIDLFPMGSSLPFRIDLFDDEIDSIRTFSIDTQRSLETIDKIQLLPAKEFPLNSDAIEFFRNAWRREFTGNPLSSQIYQDISEGISPPGIEYYLPLFFEKTATLFDYLPSNTLVIYIGDIQQYAHNFWKEIQDRFEERRYDKTHPILTPEKAFLPVTEIFETMSAYACIDIKDSSNAYHFPIADIKPLTSENALTKDQTSLTQFIQSHPGRILFCTESTGRREMLLQYLQKISLYPQLYLSWKTFIEDDKPFGICVAPLDQGFRILDSEISLLTETELLGQRIKQVRERKNSTYQDAEAIVRNLTELQISDPVVHIDHGVGRYLGLQTLIVGEQVSEFLCLEYARGDKLYVPISSLELISRYTGADPEHAPLHNLGTEQWQKVKRKAEEKVRDVAAELLEVYAKRAALAGFSYQPPDKQYEKFAASFPFEETADQKRTIEQVIQDMISDKPMDRVVCGDVGFGKTEVAMRAAFLALQSNKQVAILVPTTLLAQQHYQTFQDRFADWPIQIGILSRFRTPKEQQATLQKLREGQIDIMIGTHKLIQKEVQFKSLGLVVIDEEHLFGVHQKERLKALRANVDILTLTATPIPRTLNMALAAIRDLSIIATPPARRLSVKTFVHEYEKHIIQEAIQREILRGGQVFFVHNEVSSIDRKAEELTKLIPEARIAIAHGQMRERDLEKIMSDFYHRKFNVLVCTTIIESGIDIPTANTIIIHRADRFGLAQLHQLRGRVGRSHHQAYAYLLISSRKLITKDAIKRLDAITSLGDLGVGFTLATHDLEIRGAGELLGEEQSGNMHEVGFSLYTDLLSRAVRSLQSVEEPDWSLTLPQGPEIDLKLTALIPDHYLSDVSLRLQFYKKISHAKTLSQLDDIQVEMIDRFGLLAAPLKNLFSLAELKLKLGEIGIKKLEADGKGGKIEFSDKPHIDPKHLIHLIQTKPQRFRFEGATKMRFSLDPHESPERVQIIHQLLADLTNSVIVT